MGKASDFDVRGLILYIALLAGTVALLWHYLGSSLAWIAVVILPLAFTFLYKEQAGMGLTLFYLVNLLFAALLALLVKHVFFQRSIIRFRMIATSIAGAVLLTLYLRALYLLTGTAFPSAQYTPYLFSGLVQFIFVTFGMSMADMIIQRSTPRQQRDKDIDDGDGDPDA